MEVCGGREVNSRPYRDCDRESGRPLTYVDFFGPETLGEAEERLPLGTETLCLPDYWIYQP